MPLILKIAVVTGLITGLLVGVFDNIYMVPVLERAIALEVQRAAEQPQGQAAHSEGETPVSLGAQRIGMIAGDGIRGLLWGLVFAAGYGLLRRAASHWQHLALAATVGILAFWALSLFPFMKYPLNPPGVGEESTLLFRQFYQILIMGLSLAGAAGLLLGFQKINNMASGTISRLQMRGLLVAGYVVFLLAIFFAIPGNPDPVPVPIDLLELFRTLTMVGQFLQWALLAVGVTLALAWYEKRSKDSASGSPSPPERGVRVG